jgi:hypothetical protein
MKKNKKRHLAVDIHKTYCGQKNDWASMDQPLCKKCHNIAKKNNLRLYA